MKAETKLYAAEPAGEGYYLVLHEGAYPSKSDPCYIVNRDLLVDMVSSVVHSHYERMLHNEIRKMVDPPYYIGLTSCYHEAGDWLTLQRYVKNGMDNYCVTVNTLHRTDFGENYYLALHKYLDTLRGMLATRESELLYPLYAMLQREINENTR